MNNIYSLGFTDSRGREHAMSDLQDKVLLIVNTATKCGLAGQFEELEYLHQKYKEKGLVVLGFPCDQFQHQEPETNESMVEVCKINFGVTFLLSEKIDVNGPYTHPVFNYLKESCPGWFGKDIKWNFTKFLINRSGEPVKRLSPLTKPKSVEKIIAGLLDVSGNDQKAHM